MVEIPKNRLRIGEFSEKLKDLIEEFEDLTVAEVMTCMEETKFFLLMEVYETAKNIIKEGKAG